MQDLIKGTVQRDFLHPIFSPMDFFQALLHSIYTLSEFGLEFGEIFAISDWLYAAIYSGESILPVLFTTEWCNSPHHFGGESPFVSIICINSSLLFNTESRYSPYCLLRRVTTPRLIYSGESLLTGELFSKTLKDSPFLYRDNETKKDYPCRVLLTKSISKESKIWVT